MAKDFDSPTYLGFKRKLREVCNKEHELGTLEESLSLNHQQPSGSSAKEGIGTVDRLDCQIELPQGCKEGGDFMRKVKEALGESSHEFTAICNLLDDYYARRILMVDFKERAFAMFKEYPKLGKICDPCSMNAFDSDMAIQTFIELQDSAPLSPHHLHSPEIVSTAEEGRRTVGHSDSKTEQSQDCKDRVAFIRSVREALGENIKKFKAFHNLFEDYNEQRILMVDFKERASAMFKEHPEVIMDLNILLEAEQKELDSGFGVGNLHEDIHFYTVDGEPIDDDEFEERLEENVSYLDEDWGRQFDCDDDEHVDNTGGLFHEDYKDYEDFAYGGAVVACVTVTLDQNFMASFCLKSARTYDDVAEMICASYASRTLDIPMSHPTILYPVLGHSVTYLSGENKRLDPSRMAFRRFKAKLTEVQLQLI